MISGRGNKGRNLTSDKFFTSLRLGDKLVAKKLTLLATIRKTGLKIFRLGHNPLGIHVDTKHYQNKRWRQHNGPTVSLLHHQTTDKLMADGNLLQHSGYQRLECLHCLHFHRLTLLGKAPKLPNGGSCWWNWASNLLDFSRRIMWLEKMVVDCIRLSDEA